MKRLFFLSICIIACYSCEEIISVPDLTEENIEILAPVDGITLDSNEITFSWNEIAFADQYQIQIATPSFENASAIIVDEILEDTDDNLTRFTTVLDAGMYQWRVRGLNSNFETPFSTQNLTIIGEDQTETVDISTESITQIAPSNDIVLSNTNVTFTWNTITGATNYSLQIAFPDFNNSEQVIIDDVLDDVTSQSYDLEDNTLYEWRIKATNAISETSYSTTAFSINLVEDLSEQTVVIIAPEDNFQTSETTVNLSWEAIEEATQYRVLIINLEDDSIFLEQSTSDITIPITFEVGMYTWAVRAENSSENTPFTTQTITIL